MHLFEMIISWILGLVIDACSAIIDTLAQAALSVFVPNFGLKNGADMKINSMFGMPIFEQAYKVFLPLAIALIITKFLLNVMSDLKPGFSQREGLFQHFCRFVLALCLTGMSYWIMQKLVQFGFHIVNLMIHLDASGNSVDYGTSIASIAETNTGGAIMTDTLIIPCLIMIAITWNFLKLFMEMAERLFVTTTTTVLAPLGFCAVVSQDWEGITKRYLQMVFSTYFVTALDVFFIRAALQGMDYLVVLNDELANTGADNVLWQMIAILAILILGQRADKLVADSGLAVTQTGGNLLGEVMMASRVARDVGGMAKSAGRFGVNAARGGIKAGGFIAAKMGHGAAKVGERVRGKEANNLFRKTIGKKGADTLMKSGNWNTKNGSKEVCHMRAEQKKDGSLVTSGTLRAKNGQYFNMRTLPNGIADAKRGEGIIRTKDGKAIAVSDEGARCAMTPNGTQTMAATQSNVVKAEQALNSDLSNWQQYGYDASNQQARDTIAKSAQEQLYGHKLNEGEIANLNSTANALLNDSTGKRLEDQTIVGAWHDENEAEGVFHAMTIDNATGNINRYDIASSDNASRIDGFGGREASYVHREDVGNMEVYKTQLRTSEADTSRFKFTDANGYNFELDPDEHVVPTEYAGVYKVEKDHWKREVDETGSEQKSWCETETVAYMVPESQYTAQGRATHLGIDGVQYARIQVSKNNKMEENALLSACRNIFKWKK